MTAIARESGKYLLGSVLFAALIIGGGAGPGLTTDSLLAVMTVLAAAVVLSSGQSRPVSATAVVMSIAIVAVMLVQIVPLPLGLLDSLRPSVIADAVDLATDGGSLGFISLGVGRTLEAFVFVAAALAFMLAVMRLRPDQVSAMLPFFFMGVACNVIAGAIQYSVARDVAIDDLLPYSIRAGFFANENHFSALMFVSIPFLVYYGIVRGDFKVGLLGLLAILVMLLANGSRAGIGFGLVMTVVSLVLLSSRSRFGIASVVVVFAALSIYALSAWTKFDAETLDPEFGRNEFARTTVEGIRDNWPLGVGYGNFTRAYQIYERQEMIFSRFVNHSHNEYLELVFEGGVPAAVLLVLYIVLLQLALWRNRRDGLRKVAYLGIVFLMLHSIVDYPLRTMSLAMTFAFLNAILFHAGVFGRRPEQGRSIEVEHNGGRLLVPIDG